MNLVKTVSQKSDSEIQTLLQSDDPEMRFAAAINVGDKGLPFANDLIGLISDKDAYVRQAARQSLVVLSYYVDSAKKTNQKYAKRRAVDYGPAPAAGKYSIQDSARKWKVWVGQNKKALAKVHTTWKSTSESAEPKK